ncbi:MAG TPA: Imm51 family immunity protein [Pontiellaceae bacterium]|nr:Imm51 family immunity protein [Pontiellaceae bacterium]HPR83132.1 Imm51 family immunity protein [Pontiellaceae bacterium]
MPSWSIPSNLEEIIDSDDGGIWDDAETFAPMTLSVMKGTEYDGREIPHAWQIEFEPESEECEITNERISSMGLEADGYGWATLIDSVVRKYHPEIADELNFGDTDTASLVVWVESEATCRKVAEVAWNLIFAT